MNTKKRILFVGESSHLDTGFGNYTKNILHGLNKKGNYELAELSCFRSNRVIKTEPWKVYPVAVDLDDPLYKEYDSNVLNQFGLWRFDIALIDFKPDIVIDIRDYWNFGFESYSTLREFFHWVIVPTFDSQPPNMEELLIYKNADTVLTHSNWARYELQKYGIDAVGTVPDSVDSSIFKPIGYSKAHHKVKFGIPDNTLVIGSVMRNQKRKLFPNLIEVFANVKNKTNKNVVLYLHTYVDEVGGWDIPSLLLEYSVMNDVLFTYKCKHCGRFYPSKYQGDKTVCKFCGKICDMCSVNNSITQNDLSLIYNIFDVYVQYANSEGLGIPQLEASACGIPLVTLNADVMNEIGSTLESTLIDIKYKQRDIETNTLRNYPDQTDCVNKILEYISMPLNDLVKKSKIIRKKLKENYSWENTIDIFHNVISNINLETNNSWYDKTKPVSLEWQIPSNLPIRDTIYYIIDNYIHDEKLKKTYFIENLITRTLNGFVSYQNKKIHYYIDTAIEELKVYAKNKLAIEKFRTNIVKPSKNLNNFLNY